MISRKGIAVTVLCLFLAVPFLNAEGQSSKRGTIVVPDSSVEHPGDRGVRSHTNFVIFVPGAQSAGRSQPQANTAPSGETPASLSCVYNTWAGKVSGCPINGSYGAPSGGTNVIAIVDAYDYPTAANDFQVFSQKFGLPYGNTCGPSKNAACLTVKYASGKPRSNCGWAQEEALDIEWAHAMAPNAQIILVEAASNSNANLMQAVEVATNLVAGAGGGEVSMSWGGGESSTQTTYDTYFNGSNVAYFASSGDTGGKVIWPSTSPNVLSAGGTSVNRDANGNFTNETVWSDAGGGPSTIEPTPGYQGAIYTLAQILNGYRGTPDLSFDADPYTGVSVYDSTSCQGYVDWMVFGGTSVASPSLAGVVNYSGDFSGNNGVQSDIYQTYDTKSSGGTACSYTSPLYDVTSGTAGSYSAKGCWDYASGVGSPRGLSGSGGTSGSFSLSGSSVTVTAGSSANGSVSVTPSNAFTGNVTLSVTSSLPSGMGVSFNPDKVDITDSNAVSSVMTVSTTTSTPGGTYNLTVQGASGSLNSSTIVGVTVNSPPAAPTNLTATAGNAQVSLSWSASSGATSYTVLRSTTSGGPYASVGSGLTSTSYTDTGLTNGVTYYYVVQAANSYGSSSNSNQASATPQALTGDFSISASPGNNVIRSGSTASYTVSVSSLNSYAGTVFLSVTGGPSGTYQFSPSSISSGSGSSALTVSGVSAKGTYTLTITGTDSSGSPSHSVSVGLKIH